MIFKYILYLRCYLDDASILPCLIKRYGCVGGLINNEPFFCGGEYDTGNKFDDGFVVAQPNKKLQMLEKRFRKKQIKSLKLRQVFLFKNQYKV